MHEGASIKTAIMGEGPRLRNQTQHFEPTEATANFARPTEMTAPLTLAETPALLKPTGVAAQLKPDHADYFFKCRSKNLASCS